MTRILQLIARLFVYGSAASVAGLVGLLCMLWLKGYLTQDKALDVIAAAYGIDPFPEPPQRDETDPQVAYEKILEKRALAGMDLDLRENALDKAMADLLNQQAKFEDDRAKYNLLLEQFEQRLAELQAGATSRAIQDVLQTMLALRPEQAKQQILKLLDDQKEDQVVTLLKSMPQDSRKRILAEFGVEDAEKLYGIIQRILSGSGEGDLINAVQEQVDKFKNNQQ